MAGFFNETFLRTHPYLDAGLLEKSLRALAPGEGAFDSYPNDGSLFDFDNADYHFLKRIVSSSARENGDALPTPPPLSAAEARTLVNTFVLRDLARHIGETEDPKTGRSAEDRKIRFRASETLRILGEFASCFGTSYFSFGDVRLVADAVALRVFAETGKEARGAPLALLPFVADDFKRTFFIAAADRHSPSLVKFRASLLSRVLSEGRLHAERPLDDIYSNFTEYSLEGASAEKSPHRSLRLSADAVASDFTELSKAVVGDIDDSFFSGDPYPGGRTAFLLSGRTAGTSFWIPSIPEESFEKCSEFLKTFEFPKDCEGALSCAGKALADSGIIAREDAESLFILSNAISGKFDVFSFSRAKSPWTDRISDIRVSSPFDSDEFLSSFDEYASKSPFGETIRGLFIADCLRAFSVSDTGFDLTTFGKKNGKDGDRVSARLSSALPVHAAEWISERLPDVLSYAERSGNSFLNALSMPCAANVLVPSMFLRLCLVLSKDGVMPPRDAVAASVLLKDGTFSKKLAHFVSQKAERESLLEKTVLSILRGSLSLYFTKTFETHPLLERKHLSEKSVGIFTNGASALLTSLLSIRSAVASNGENFAEMLALKLDAEFERAEKRYHQMFPDETPDALSVVESDPFFVGLPDNVASRFPEPLFAERVKKMRADEFPGEENDGR